LVKLNSFEEKDIKHVRSVILKIKIIGKIHQNVYILREKVKIREIMFCWKKKCNFAGKAALLRFFSETKKIRLY